MPTLHNPLGWVTPQQSRQQLVAIAREHELLIIEDAAYAFLVEKPPTPLAALAPESTFYVSGLSKSVATGLRFGFVVAPTEFTAALQRVIRATTWNTPALITAIATGWLNDGTVTRLEARSAPTPSAGKPWPATFSTDSTSSDIRRRTFCGFPYPRKPEPTK